MPLPPPPPTTTITGKGYALAFVGVLITDLLTSFVGLHPNREGQVQKFPSSFPMFFHNSLNPKVRYRSRHEKKYIFYFLKIE